MIPSQTKEFLASLVDEGIIPEQFVEEVTDLAAEHFKDYIAIGWTTDDILDRAESRGIELSNEQARDILESIARGFDANNGINWDVIDTHTDMEIA